MKNSSWKDYAEIAGVAAIVASLMFVGLQMRQDREIALVSTNATILESFVQINSDINQHAEIWNTGLAGDELSGADAIIFRNLAASLRRHAVISSTIGPRLGGNRPRLTTFQFADLVRQNPGLEREMSRESVRVRALIAASSMPLEAGAWTDRLHEAIERLNRLD